ncbi:conserved hypothetical protein [Aspergillus terreus NIH2624]|uniref:Presequence protease, mitochondrial n=1 Tax=Aspergillus terreus (strain NIH 2624 / FGSC A1156) TaxID=341663 RepID=Q0CLM4_ASPTN|nr:uncharacterized protein ATEG_05410 [Aspergillus terreus NIH2624]EAU34479.1 conserved hypothetical protein [Aspergillus terreus NIH2624]
MFRSSLASGKGRVPFLRQPSTLAPRRLSTPTNVLSRYHQHRAASTVTSLDSYPAVGEKLHGFTVQEKKHVPELHLTAIRLTHDKTAADYLHVAREDKNNVFGVGFKTNPPDATGVPHILEHTTLCGSEKFPIRDPFFKMLPRSLSNFMNAFTSSDHTTYPFATTNQQDFQNLLSVYLDATFHPLLKEEDFRQEGWRLGPEDPRAAQTQSPEGKPEDVLFKGVVYNEMKGQISDANYLYYIKYKESIIPALNNSGGDPQYITDLTYKQLVDFSKRNYHPSNAKFLTYGDMPLSGHLKQIGAVLDGFEKGAADTAVKSPLDLSNGPVNITVPGPIDTFSGEDKQFKTSTSWYMGDSRDVVETFSAGILSSLLLDGYGSPMYRALIESGLGSSFTPNTGLDASGRVPVFSVGVNGVSEEDAPKVKEAIQGVYQESLANGFVDEKVQGFLHQLELALRHKTANFGIGVMEKTLSSWFNGANPMEELAWNEIVDEFKKRYQQDMLQILTTLITETDFTSPYAPGMIQELLRLTTNGALDAVAGTGHRFALNAAAASLSRSFWVQEQQSGLAQLQATADLLRDAETSPERLAELIEKLRLIQSFAISKSQKLRVRLVCEPTSAHQNESVLQKWLAGLPQVQSPTVVPDTILKSAVDKAFYDLPYKVYYSGLAMQTVPFVHSSSAPLSVLSQLLTHNYLHPEIREKGGAYGAAATNGPIKGIFALTSYRDPNPLNTLKVFQNSGIFARDRQWSDRELNEAKLGIFQGLDAPMSVDEEGARYFMSGVTHEMDQRWREQVLDVTAKDVNEAAQAFLVDGPRQSICLLGEKKDWAESEGWEMRKLTMNTAGDADAQPMGADASV